MDNPPASRYTQHAVPEDRTLRARNPSAEDRAWGQQPLRRLHHAAAPPLLSLGRKALNAIIMYAFLLHSSSGGHPKPLVPDKG